MSTSNGCTNPSLVPQAAQQSCQFSSYADLAQKPEVYELILQEILRVNASLNAPLRIKQFVLLHKELDPDDAEITRTRKLRRRFVYDKYREVVDAMYSEGEPEVKVRAIVTYEDGRTSEIERSLRIRAVGDGGADTAVLMGLCLAENDRRFAGYDARLLRPTTVPRVVRRALRVMRLVERVRAKFPSRRRQ